MYATWQEQPQEKKEQHWQQLGTAYRDLSSTDKQIVQVLAIAYAPHTFADLADLLDRAGIRPSRASKWTAANVKPYTDRLAKQLGVLAISRRHGVSCHPALLEIATRDALTAGNFETFSTAVRERDPVTQYSSGIYQFIHGWQFVREVRIAIYEQAWEAIERFDKDYQRFKHLIGREQMHAVDVLEWVCSNPLDSEWLGTLPKPLYETVLGNLLGDAVWFLEPADTAWELLQTAIADGLLDMSERAGSLLIEQHLFRGELDAAEGYLRDIEPGRYDRRVQAGWLEFIRGNNDRAIAHFETAFQELKKATGKRKYVAFASAGGIFFILALLKDGSPQRLQEAADYLEFWGSAKNKHWLQSSYAMLAEVVEYHRFGNAEFDAIAPYWSAVPEPEDTHSTGHLVGCLCTYWRDKDVARGALPLLLETLCEKAETAGFFWFAEQFGDLSMRVRLGDRAEVGEDLEEVLANPGAIAKILQTREPWEFALDALCDLQLPSDTAEPESSSRDKRLAWFLTWYSHRHWMLQPREQKIKKDGIWSKGRPIALKRLYKNAEQFDYFTDQDWQICTRVERYEYGPYGYTDYRIAPQALSHLVGHPLVFSDDGSTRLDVVSGEPELQVKRAKAGWLTIQLVPPLPSEGVLPMLETSTRLKVITVTEAHRQIGSILGDKYELRVPEAATERVLNAIAAVSGLVAVQSDIGGVSNLREVTADSKPYFQILPDGDGLRVGVRVRPFAADGPDFVPGRGSETAIAEVSGERVQTHRDLRAERQRLEEALAACPTLSNQEEDNGEWSIPDPESCLEVLLELQDLGDTAAVEWPEGEKFKIAHRADTGSFKLGLARQRDWFAVEGELALDDDLVLDMQQLLGLLANTPGRFVPLGDGQFLALTETFRKRLEDLRTFTTKRGDSYGLHPLAAHALQDFTEEVGTFEADKHWRDRVLRLREMENLDPQVPSTLQAELRDYQEEGFRWLARLAHWGVGACLADDMGLGKTLQALALVLTRSPQGPTLAIAPTSVCGNWEAEIQKFAPTLNPLDLNSGDRQKTLERLQAFDVLLCSYGLLQQEDVAAMLAEVEWETVILDEAQAIKNAATKRSRAAMSLQAGFKLILTGTPIENHLGELWNLFQFINPGLLGSLESFNHRFALPIERDNDKQARERLKKLVRPFLLRRRKTQVLEELPPRTEISIRVELSEAEMAFYEALRREAIANVTDSDAKAGAKHLQVLAEIMRLRRACCHPRLVDQNLDLPSAKLEQFGEVLAEILDNNHKALVFSQFVDYLHIARDYLDSRGISYQYLDGSTKASDRRKRVQAFQAGEGDVFLISLKAGGTGLNLTAADYVIHLDPWWNPAVEDQASDRAHRIGQQRPVTIYRLVASGTIEEKIVDLHRHKRDLADSLLAGADAGGKLSTDALLDLMGA